MEFKHLVILGAGSTIATIPNGDKNGQRAFALDDLLTDPHLKNFVNKLSPEYQNINTEELFEKLYECDRELYDKLESLIRIKYGSLELPDEFTLLERLIMSLTNNDAIVSFNWDDLVIQAYNRVLEFIPEKFLPKICFPHGNAQACYNEKRYGSKRNPDNIGLKDSPLNMPVDGLKYKENIFIKDQWSILDFYVKAAQMITFFGYRGPISDKQDMEHLEELLKKNLICTKIEIIDKSKESAGIIAKDWESIINLTENKADLCGSFYESRMAQYPRKALQSLGSWKYKPTLVNEESQSEFLERIQKLIG